LRERLGSDVEMKELPVRCGGGGAEGAGGGGEDRGYGNGDSGSPAVCAAPGGNRHSQPPLERCSFRPVMYGAFRGRDATCREILLLWRKNNAGAEFRFRNQLRGRATRCGK